jgi:hypothetical protein
VSGCIALVPEVHTWCLQNSITDSYWISDYRPCNFWKEELLLRLVSAWRIWSTYLLLGDQICLEWSRLPSCCTKLR